MHRDAGCNLISHGDGMRSTCNKIRTEKLVHEFLLHQSHRKSFISIAPSNRSSSFVCYEMMKLFQPFYLHSLCLAHKCRCRRCLAHEINSTVHNVNKTDIVSLLFSSFQFVDDVIIRRISFQTRTKYIWIDSTAHVHTILSRSNMFRHGICCARINEQQYRVHRSNGKMFNFN